MKRIISVGFFMIFSIAILNAQTINDAIKMLSYGKNISAKAQLQKLYEANDKDETVVYWLGQSMIAVDDVSNAKAFYQKALSNGLNLPLIWIGIAHTELLEGGNWEAAREKFEQAITFTTETRGRNKGKPSVAVLNAIGRANCMGHLMLDGSSKFGNMDYAIEKLKLASTIDITNSESFIYMGLCYRKMGGEFGGEAQKAYMEANNRNPLNPVANYLIGKIYLSQLNKPFMEQYFNAALAIDVAFAPVYLDFYNYYSNREVNIAKDYIEKYLQFADKDCNNDYFYADYLFRAGNYQASLNKAKELENTECKARVPILFAYNFDRLNDSLKAKANIEKFFSTIAPDKILVSDYEIAFKVFARFQGFEKQSVCYANKVIELDTLKNTKLQYLSQVSELYEKAKMYLEQIKILDQIVVVRGTKTEYDFYKITSTSYNSGNFDTTILLAKDYIINFPAKPQGYDFYVKSAKKIDTSNVTGLYFEAISKQIEYYLTDTVKYKQSLVNNYYIQMAYYNDTKKDYVRAIEVCDKILILVPGEPQTVKIRESLVKNSGRRQ